MSLLFLFSFVETIELQNVKEKTVCDSRGEEDDGTHITSSILKFSRVASPTKKNVVNAQKQYAPRH